VGSTILVTEVRTCLEQKSAGMSLVSSGLNAAQKALPEKKVNEEKSTKGKSSFACCLLSLIVIGDDHSTCIITSL
jgi:hypothetical protein